MKQTYNSVDEIFEEYVNQEQKKILLDTIENIPDSPSPLSQFAIEEEDDPLYINKCDNYYEIVSEEQLNSATKDYIAKKIKIKNNNSDVKIILLFYYYYGNKSKRIYNKDLQVLII